MKTKLKAKEKSKRKYEEKLSLNSLPFHEAVSALLKVKPMKQKRKN